MINGNRWPLVLAVALSALLVGTPEGGADPTPRGPGPKDEVLFGPQGEPLVLLLRSGAVLQGTVAKVGDGYRVTFPGGEINVKAADVQSVCRSIDEVYQRRRALMRLDSALEHLEMAQWCLRSGLAGAARAELAEAIALDPTHPMIPLVQRRLDLASQPVKTTPVPSVAARPGPSIDELDRMIRSMPPGTVASFSRTIQPILVNHCAASGCHGPGATKGFQLTRLPPGGTPSPRLTQRNLHAAIQHVDWANPGSSPLARVPASPHGTARSAVFTTRQQYEQVLDWCYDVARAPSPVVQTSHEEPVEGRGEKAVMVKRQDSVRRPSSRPGQAEKPSAPTRAPGAGQPAEKLRPGTGTGTGAAPRRGAGGAAGASDPFDPEVFNRRFAPPPPSAPLEGESEPPRADAGDEPPLPPAPDPRQ